MRRFCDKARIAPNLLLALLLVAAQSLASMHELQHDAGSPQNQICTICVAASQLGAACVDSSTDVELETFVAQYQVPAAPVFDSRHTLTARQRGPPAIL